MAGRWTRRVLLGLPTALVLIVLAAATRIVPPIFGRIVDAATGKPVRGVLVSLEYTRYHGLGSAETVVYSQATTNRWGWFWLMPAVAWSEALAPFLPAISEHWLTINQVPVDGRGSFHAAENSALYDPTSKRDGMKVSNPAYFPLTVAYYERQTCDQSQAWFATCVDGRAWWNVTIPLTPVLDTPDRCTRVLEADAYYRCRQLNTYHAAFLHVDTFDDVQRGVALCAQLPIDRIRQACRDQLGVYVANPTAYGRSEPRAEPRIAQFFPVTIAGEHRADFKCDWARYTSGHLDCWAKYYGEGLNGIVIVAIEEWAGREEPPEEKRDLLKGKPNYDDAPPGVVTTETRSEGIIRLYRGPTVKAADWVSHNRYVRVYAEHRTEMPNAFIEFLLRPFPSTLH